MKLEATRTLLVFIAVGGIAFVLSLFFDFSICPIYNITGIPCFSCGMTRAFRSLPDFRQAFRYHPLFFVVVLVPGLAFLKEKPRNIVTWALIGLLIVVWVWRMIAMFPHTDPMKYNYRSLFEVVRRWIFN